MCVDALNSSALNNAVCLQSTYFMPPSFSPFSLNTHVSLCSPCLVFPCFTSYDPTKNVPLFSLAEFLPQYREKCEVGKKNTEREVPESYGCRPITIVVAHVRGGSCRYLTPFIQPFLPSPHLNPHASGL